MPAAPAPAAPATAQDDMAQDDTTPAAGRRRPRRGRKVAAKPQETNKFCFARRTLCSCIQKLNRNSIVGLFLLAGSIRSAKQDRCMTGICTAYDRGMQSGIRKDILGICQQHLFEIWHIFFEVWIYQIYLF